MNLRPNSKQEIFVNFFLKVKNLCSLKNKGRKKTMSLLKEFQLELYRNRFSNKGTKIQLNQQNIE